MNDLELLAMAHAEEAVRRMRAEIALHNTVTENKRLAARLAEWDKAHPEGLPGDPPKGPRPVNEGA